jgi:glycosyltransferase involved in cell wall biosynthesis
VDTLSNETFKAKKNERPFFLFVGSGTYRKGLHHLCNAWKNTSLVLTHDLLIIARTVDPSIKPYLKFQGIRWIAGVSKEELTGYFQNALCFVMPSLSEGFGQVYLEALANGCPVIGSMNSMLPDIVGGQNHILFVDPTSEAEISSALQKVFNTPSSDNFFNKDAIRALVIPYTWENFRAGIHRVLENFD